MCRVSISTARTAKTKILNIAIIFYQKRRERTTGAVNPLNRGRQGRQFLNTITLQYMTNLVGLIDSDTGKICIMIDPLKVSFFLREKNNITIVVDGARIDYHFTQSSADILQRVIEDANRLNANNGKDGNV